MLAACPRCAGPLNAYGVCPRCHVAGPPRGGTARVMGILLIVFGSLGLLVGALLVIGVLAALSDVGGRTPPDAVAFLTINVIGLGVSGLQLAAGIRTAGFRRGGPPLAVGYAVSSIITTLLGFAVLVLADKGHMGGSEVLILFFMICLLTAWPIVVLAIMRRPAVREVCDR